MSRSILLVDDDASVLDLLARYFDRAGWSVHRAMTGSGAVEISERERPHLVLLDLELPDSSGLAVLESLRRLQPEPVVLMLTGHGDIDTAVAAMKLGAENYLTKPIELDHLGAAVDRAAEKADLRRHNRYLVERAREAVEGEPLGRSPQMREVQRRVERIAAGDSTVLLQGETGTGKGRVARMIHDLSPRAGKPYVAISCAGLAPSLLETELFGRDREGSAEERQEKPGLFEVASGGTVFLDEIAEMDPVLQPTLLQVLDSRRFRRPGGRREVEVDIRLIAATHQDLQGQVSRGRFRADLYYRLAVLPVQLPPLRSRSAEDLAALASKILGELRRAAGAGPTRIGPEALQILTRHRWPGNIRELRNVLERVVILSEADDEIRPHHLPPDIRRGDAPSLESEPETLEDVERRHIARMLERNSGNRSRTARMLGISRATLYEKMERYGLERIGR